MLQECADTCFSRDGRRIQYAKRKDRMYLQTLSGTLLAMLIRLVVKNTIFKLLSLLSRNNG